MDITNLDDDSSSRAQRMGERHKLTGQISLSGF